MGADEPGFDRAEQGVDDREELGGLGALVLDNGRVFEMVIERCLLTLLAGKAIGHEVRFDGDIVFQEDAQFGSTDCRQHADPGTAGVEAVLSLQRMAMVVMLVSRGMAVDLRQATEHARPICQQTQPCAAKCPRNMLLWDQRSAYTDARPQRIVISVEQPRAADPSAWTISPSHPQWHHS